MNEIPCQIRVKLKIVLGWGTVWWQISPDHNRRWESSWPSRALTARNRYIHIFAPSWLQPFIGSQTDVGALKPYFTNRFLKKSLSGCKMCLCRSWGLPSWLSTYPLPCCLPAAQHIPHWSSERPVRLPGNSPRARWNSRLGDVSVLRLCSCKSSSFSVFHSHWSIGQGALTGTDPFQKSRLLSQGEAVAFLEGSKLSSKLFPFILFQL